MDFLGSGRWVREKAAVLCTVLREEFQGLPSALQRGFAKSFICHARGIQIKLPELCQNLIFFPVQDPRNVSLSREGLFYFIFLSLVILSFIILDRDSLTNRPPMASLVWCSPWRHHLFKIPVTRAPSSSWEYSVGNIFDLLIIYLQECLLYVHVYVTVPKCIV